MLRYMLLTLFWLCAAVLAYTTDQIMERLYHVEDRINSENKFRREDFKRLFTEIGKLNEMIQHNINGNNIKETVREVTATQVPNQRFDELKNMITRALKAFGDEKRLNSKSRRDIPIVQRQIRDLRAQVEQNRELIESNIKTFELKMEEIMTRNKVEFDSLSNDIKTVQRIQGQCSTDIKEMEKVVTSYKVEFDSLSNDIKTLQRVQGQCLTDIKETFDLTNGISASLSTGELVCSVHEQSNASKFLTSSVDTIAKAGKSCKELYNSGQRMDNVYKIEVEPGNILSVYCDMTSDNGGWTVFQRRKDGSVDFYRDWEDYKSGFGELTGEFWLGNKYLNLLTDSNETHELRVDLEDHEGNKAYAKYKIFKVWPEDTMFRLEVTGYSGTAGDSMDQTVLTERRSHNGMSFTTKDRDNDENVDNNCGTMFKSAWWYNNCYGSNLNGPYHQKSECGKEWVCIVWNKWKGSKYSLTFTEMKLR